MAVLKNGVALAKATFKDFSQDEATFKAAALAYYTVFALPPLLVLLMQVAGMVWDPAEVQRALTGEFGSMMGDDVGSQVGGMISSAQGRTEQTGWRLALGIGGLLFGATGAFVSLQSALNKAWEVKPDPKQGGIKNFVMKRVLSLGMVMGLGFLMAVSLALTSVLSAAGGAIFGGLPEAVGHVLNFVLTFAVLTLLFAAMFKILPDAKVNWRDVWVGGAVTAALFVIGKFLIGFYIGRSDPGSAFGAAGALAVLLVWIYYAAVIVLLGAEFTQAWIKQRGGRIEPEEGAVRIVERKEQIDSSGQRTVESEGHEMPERHGNEQSREPETIENVQRELAATREHMSDVIAELDARVSGAVQAVKHRADVVRLVREHPWPAVATAFVAGAAIAATGADEKAADATVSAAKSAPDAISSGATQAVHAVKDKLSRTNHGDGNGNGAAGNERGGIRSRIQALLAAEARFLGAELGRAADELVGSITRRP